MDKKETNKEEKTIKNLPSINKGENIKEEVITLPVEEIPNKVATVPAQNQTMVLSNLNTPDKLLAFATTLVNAKMCAFKEPADAMVALITGQEMGLGLAAVLSGIHVIEGKPSLGVHIKKGILLQKNVIYKKIRDMEKYYEFVEIIDGKASIVLEGYLDEQPPGTKKKHIDTRTEYLFTRYFNTARGLVKNTAIGMFGIVEATQAGLIEKQNWIKYTRDMLSSRAFSRGSNEIADDLLNGMLSFSELADINDGVTYYIDNNGHEQIVK